MFIKFCNLLIWKSLFFCNFQYWIWNNVFMSCTAAVQEPQALDSSARCVLGAHRRLLHVQQLAPNASPPGAGHSLRRGHAPRAVVGRVPRRSPWSGLTTRHHADLLVVLLPFFRVPTPLLHLRPTKFSEPPKFCLRCSLGPRLCWRVKMAMELEESVGPRWLSAASLRTRRSCIHHGGALPRLLLVLSIGTVQSPAGYRRPPQKWRKCGTRERFLRRTRGGAENGVALHEHESWSRAQRRVPIWGGGATRD
jgi:hypothetical protein